MKAVILNVMTKAGNEYIFSDLNRAGSGMSALTQLTSEQDIHAYGVSSGSTQVVEYYIPFCAIDYATKHEAEAYPGLDDICDANACDDVKFYSRVDSDITQIRDGDTLTGMNHESATQCELWCGESDGTIDYPIRVVSSDPSGLEVIDDETPTHSKWLWAHQAGTYTVTITASNGCHITVTVVVS